MKLISLLIIILTFFQATPEKNVLVNVEIKGIRSSNGIIHLSAFKTNEQFDEEIPVLNFPIEKTNLSHGNLKTTIQLPQGEWGITLLDDENENDEMDYSWLRIPEEGFGFSNYYLDGLSKPDMKEFMFKVDSSSTNNIKIKVRYM